MAKDIWVISDTHLFHANILKFQDARGNLIRPFDSVDEMNQCMLDNWNSVVKPGDKVYHLGDVFLGDKEAFKKLWPKFNGSKRLIVGNHDDIRFLTSGGFFKQSYMWRMLKDFGLLLTHVPVHSTALKRRESRVDGSIDYCMLKNVHGHIHQNNSPGDVYPGDHYVNVCVEKTNYTPVNIEELRIR